MATRVADLEVRVGYDGDKAEKGLRNLGQQAGNSGSVLKTAAGSMLGFIGASVALPAIQGSFGFLKDSIFGVGHQLESAQIGFTNMMGSAEQAGAFLEELKQFAATTPFEFPDVQQGAQRLMAMGIEADKVVPTLSSVGNAVAAMGGGAEVVQRVTMALGQMSAKGKVSAEEMLQLAEAGIPAWDMLATSMGKTVPEVQDLVTKGQVASDVFLEAFNTEVPERFGDAMQQQSQTLTGLMSTLKDTVSMGLADLGRPLIEQLTKVMPPLIEAVGPLMTSLGTSLAPVLGFIGSIVGQLATGLVPILDEVGKVVGEVLPYFLSFFQIIGSALGPALQQLVPAFGQILEALGPLLPAVGELAGALISALAPVLADLLLALVPLIPPLVSLLTMLVDLVTPILENESVMGALVPVLLAAGAAFAAFKVVGLVSGMSSLLGPTGAVTKAVLGLNAAMVANPIGIVVAAIAALVAGLVWLYMNVEPVREAFDAVGRVIADVAKAVWDFLQPAIEWVKEAFGEVAEAVGALFKGDFSKLGELFAKIGDALWEALQALPGLLADGLGMLWDALVTWFTETLPQITAQLAEWGLALVGWIWESLPGWLAALGELWLQLQMWLIGILAKLPPLLWQLATALVQWIWDSLPGWLASLAQLAAFLLGWIIGLAAQLPGWAWQLYVALIQWLVESVPGWIGKLAELAGTVLGWALDLVGKIPGWLLGAVAAALEWVVNAARDMPGKLQELALKIMVWAINLPGKIVNWLKGALGSMLDVGKDIVQGLIDGVGAMAGMLWDAAQSIAGSFLDGLASAFGLGSPSRVTRQVGEWLGEGLRLGVEESMPDVQGMLNESIPQAVSLGVTGSIAPPAMALAGGGMGSQTVYGDVNVNVRVDGGDPEAVVNALRRWTDRNGPVPLRTTATGAW